MEMRHLITIHRIQPTFIMKMLPQVTKIALQSFNPFNIILSTMHKKCPIFKNDIKLDIDQYIAPKHHKSYLACIMNLNSEFNLLQDQSQSKLISNLNQTLTISSINILP